MLSPAALAREWILWIIVTLSLGAGLVGAYGRERHEGRLPAFDWWLTRLCIMPFLAIVVAFAIDQFDLSRQQTALLASLLALMGYEAVRIIIERARRSGDALIEAVTPKPYGSIVDTDSQGRTTVHIVPTNERNPRRGGIGEGMKGVYASSVSEELPADLNRLVDKLDGKEDDVDSYTWTDPTV